MTWFFGQNLVTTSNGDVLVNGINIDYLAWPWT